MSVPSGSSVTLPSGSGLSRSGYTFGAWNTKSDGAGTNYNAGSSYTPAGNVTLYAKWTSTGEGTPSVGEIEMVSVAGGTFTMGCTPEQGNDCYSNESPAHSVTLSNFSIGKYEVTQGQWKAVMGSLPSSVSSSYGYGDNYPVYYVSWNDIQTFLSTLNSQTGKNYRLPTEAEWEYAARGGNRSGGYKYSGSNNIGYVAWYSGNSNSRTHEVGTKSPNELGIYDMSGNVYEWVSDWYNSSYYSSSPETNPTGPASGSIRVIRGGSWGYGAGNCRVSIRFISIPDFRSFNLGFRLAVSP